MERTQICGSCEVVGGPSLPRHGGGGEAITWRETRKEKPKNERKHGYFHALYCSPHELSFGSASSTRVVPCFFLHGQRTSFFLIGLHPDLQERTHWYQLLLVSGNIIGIC